MLPGRRPSVRTPFQLIKLERYFMSKDTAFETLNRPSIIIAVFLILISLSGCYSASSLDRIPQYHEEILRIKNANKSDIPSFISSVDVTANDAATNTSEGFERRFLGHLQQSNFFRMLFMEYTVKNLKDLMLI